MRKKVFKRTLSLIMTMLLCVTAIVGTGAFSVQAAGYQMYLRGDFNNWGASTEYLMTNDNNNHCSITVTLDAGNYDFKAATSNWTSCVIPEGDNASVTLTEKSQVTFVADFGSKTVQAFVASTRPQTEAEGVTIRSKWMEHKVI